MKVKFWVALVALAIVAFPPVSAAGNTGVTAEAKLAAVNAMRNLPLSFEPAATPGSFVARSRGGYTVSIGATESSVAVPGAAAGTASLLRFGFEGASAATSIEGFEPLPGVTNYYLGNDPAKWRLRVKNFAKLRAAGVYPGVDVVYYGDHRRLEFDFLVAPNASPDPIALAFSGMDKLYIASDGDLLAEVNGQPVRFAKPYAYQKVAGVAKPVSVEYVVNKAGKAQLQIGEYDKSLELVIDPVLSYATYLGGSQGDQANGIAVDTSGNAYITGQTCSSSFTGTANSYGGCSAFVTKLNAAGTAVIYTTIVGGNHTASGNAIALDSSDNVYIAGTTNSNLGFPNVVNSYNGGDSDAFIAEISYTGTLTRTAYLGGSDADTAYGIAVDSTGNVIVAGQTKSGNFPAYSGFEDKVETYVAFVTKLDNTLDICTPGARYANPGTTTSGTCYFSLFYGGQPPNVPGNSVGNPGYWIQSHEYLYGDIISVPVYNPVTGTYANYAEKCISPGTSGSSAPAWAIATNTGSVVSDNTVTWQNEGTPALLVFAQTQANGVAVDPLGDVYAAGASTSQFIGCTNCGFSNWIGAGAWVLKVNGSTTPGGQYRYATVLGTTSTDSANGIAVDTQGRAYVVGTSTGGIFITTNAFQSSVKGAQDAFLLRMNTAGSAIDYATYLGGSGNDQGFAVAVDPNGAAYITGSTESTDFPMVNPLTNQTTNLPMSALTATENAFIAKVIPNGSALGFSTYLGGTNLGDADYGTAIAVSQSTTSDNNIYVAGASNSSDFPVYPITAPTAYQTVYGNNGDAFASVILGSSVPAVGGSTGTSSDFTVSANGVSVARGAQGSMTVTLTPVNGFNQTLNLSCSVPAPATCTVSPTSVHLTGSAALTAMATVSVPSGSSGSGSSGGGYTPKGSSSSLHHGNPWRVLMPFSMFGLAFLGRRRRFWLPLLVLCLCLVLSFVNCGGGTGGGSSSSATLAPGTYQATVTATYTAGSITHSSASTLTVN
jgi:hypothetical protein